jgi:hypothetical protein
MPRSATVRPRRISGVQRLNLTFRYLRPEYLASALLCHCKRRSILKASTKKGQNFERHESTEPVNEELGSPSKACIIHVAQWSLLVLFVAFVCNFGFTRYRIFTAQACRYYYACSLVALKHGAHPCSSALICFALSKEGGATLAFVLALLGDG